MTKEEEVELIIRIVNHPAGFDLGLFGLLGIRSHSDGYEVSWEENGITIEANNCAHKNFTSLISAAEFFVDKRHERELGLDIEERLMKENNERKEK